MVPKKGDPLRNKAARIEPVEATGNRVRSFPLGTHETTSWNGGVVLRSRSMQKKIQLKYRGVPYTKTT